MPQITTEIWVIIKISIAHELLWIAFSYKEIKVRTKYDMMTFLTKQP